MKASLILTLTILGVVYGDENFLKQYTVANHKIARDFYRELTKTTSKNLIYSPLSAQLILTLTRLGASGETAQELDKGLSLPTDVEYVKSAVNQLQTELKEEKPYTINAVNKLYVKTGYSIKPSYVETAKKIFSADIENIDFSKTQEASQQINEYVEKETDSLIKNLVEPDKLNDLTRLILINTLYFKANWSKQFNDVSTTPEKFTKSLSESVTLPFMTDTDYYKYAEIPELDAKWLQIPYIGDEVDLNIFLPNKIDGLGIIENNLDKICEPKNLTYSRVALRFPKFKVESDLKLVPVLKNLGIKQLFDEQKCDLSEIANPDPRLFVNDVIQKVYIKFTESGTTAAAATAVFAGVPYSSSPVPDPVPFVVDHPFIFYIKNKRFVLFAGRIVSPELEV